jgi:hypothetical protein
MENYATGEIPPLENALADVARSDVYVCILAWHYGYVPPNEDLSIVELEYRRAEELGKPCLVFLLSGDVAWPIKFIDSDSRLAHFRSELLRHHMVSLFSNPNDLAVQVATALHNREKEFFGKNNATKTSPSVFISYSHTDARWLSRLQIHLRVIERLGVIDLWSDTRIKSGAKWKKEIAHALDSASAAILLLSADFLASEFVMTNELPPLLAAAEKKGVLILPLIVSACRFQAVKDISQFQAINDPRKPLNVMTKGRQEQVFDRVADLIINTFPVDGAQ